MCVLFYCKTQHIIQEKIIYSDNNLQNKPIYAPYIFNNNPNNPNSIDNPYSPPLTAPQEPIHSNDIRGWPINMSTRPMINNNYSQQGLLTRINGEETILPLMGRQLMSGRDKWQYYTISDKNNAIKLPISVNGKSCTSEYGCNSLSNNDTVYVEGYDDAFKTTMYESSALNYIPYL